MGEGKPLNTEKAIISNFESLREEQDELAQSLNARSADLQASGASIRAPQLPCQLLCPPARQLPVE